MSSNTPSDDAEEPVAWMYPDDIERFKTNETFAQAYSIKCRSPTQGTTEPLYLHPPKPAEPDAEIIETLKAENFKLASGQCTEGGPWGDEGGTPYCKYAEPAARKPMTEEEIKEAHKDSNCYVLSCVDPLCNFSSGVRFAERHHFGIGERDE